MSQASLDFEQRQIYSVTHLNREARMMVESQFGLIWIEGEISNLARPSSGHLYFSLKDESSHVRCALFRQHGRSLDFEPGNGMQVLVRARVSLYEARGEFQLIAQHMEPAGQGALQRTFEALKGKLLKEGLFDEIHKQVIPALPHRIGVITSPTGAAVRDVLKVFSRRFPGINVLIYPVAVQGNEAKGQIANAILIANERQDCDVLLIIRGGGSLEDLWAFNEETVARAVFASQIPIVSGIGHEVDFTITDLVADLRAPTPSVAAEMVTPDARQLARQLALAADRIHKLADQILGRALEKLTWLGQRLKQQHPGQLLRQRTQRVDELEQRLLNALGRLLADRQTHLRVSMRQLMSWSPNKQISRLAERCTNLNRRLIAAKQALLERLNHRVILAANGLNQVSPLATLDRGYAIVMDQHKDAIRDASKVQKGTTVTARLAEGSLEAKVTKVHD